MRYTALFIVRDKFSAEKFREVRVAFC